VAAASDRKDIWYLQEMYYPERKQAQNIELEMPSIFPIHLQEEGGLVPCDPTLLATAHWTTKASHSSLAIHS
jgi:hypothetical protein